MAALVKSHVTLLARFCSGNDGLLPVTAAGTLRMQIIVGLSARRSGLTRVALSPERAGGRLQAAGRTRRHKGIQKILLQSSRAVTLQY
jgi:hypothetical protein